jgi:hypothetical protein
LDDIIYVSCYSKTPSMSGEGEYIEDRKARDRRRPRVFDKTARLFDPEIPVDGR